VDTHRIARDRVAAGKPVWAHTVRIARDPESPFEVNRDNTVRTLRRSSWLRAAESVDPFSRLSDLVDELADAERVEEFDMMLDEVYDIADIDRCFIQFVRP
jgi:hypothetical protein